MFTLFVYWYGHLHWTASICPSDPPPPFIILLCTLKADMHTLSQSFSLMSHWIHPKVAPTGGCRARGEQGLGIHSPLGFSSWLCPSLEGGLPGSPLHTAVFSGFDICTLLTIARCYPVTCGFLVPCFICNTFIKLHSDCPI